MASLRELPHLSPQQWLELSSRVLPPALSVVLVVAIAWQLVQLTWLVLDRGPEPPPAVPPQAVDMAPGAERPGADLQRIVRAHLFGRAQAQAAQSPATAPQTQMNLVLSAVLAAEDPKHGLAVIGPSVTASKLYRVGDPIDAGGSGTRLHEVYPDRVILDRNGRLESLPLPKQSATGMSMARAPVPPPAPPPGQFGDRLRRFAQNNPGALAEIIRPQPVFANGVQRGYRVYPGRNRQAFSKLGLQPGDLILSISGTPLDDPQRSLEIFNTLSTSDQVGLTIERGGQIQEITLNAAQISLPEAEPDGGQPAPENDPAAQDGAPDEPVP
ncbi:MAG: type II secretion system protein GspC [Proteobacteria bacterium]|nr:MAG: type II secretion system protein GspC [Pseudomonadota bacterium]